MTTTVMVTTTTWPVKVTTLQKIGSEDQVIEEVVPPKTERTFHIHNTLSLGLEELPEPPVANLDPTEQPGADGATLAEVA